MSVFKRSDGRYQVSYRDEDGKGRTKMFPRGKTGKKLAEAFDAEVKYKKKAEQPLPMSSREGVFLDDLAQEWLNAKLSQGRKAGWLSDWANILNEHILPGLIHRPAHQLTQADVLAIVGRKWSRASQSTRNRYIGYLKSIFEHGVEQGHLPRNPLAAWVKGKEPRYESRLTLEDLRKVQQIAPAHLAWALNCAWNIPVRPGLDLFGLRFDRHVDFERMGLNVFHSKVGKWAWIPCNEGFMRALSLRVPQQKSGHLIEYAGKPVKRMDTALVTAARRAGLTYAVCMYDIRHLWITTMLNKCVEPSVVAEMAGTSVEMIVKNYYEPHSAEKARAVGLLPRLRDEEQVAE